MKNAFLSTEEAEFFSAPLLPGPSSTENLYLNRISPDLDSFLATAPTRRCAVICTSPVHANTFLRALNAQGNTAGELLVFDRRPSQFAGTIPDKAVLAPPLFTSTGCVNPATRDKLITRKRETSGMIRHVLFPSEPQLAPDNLENMARAQAQQHAIPVVFFVLFSSPLRPAQLATVLSLYPAVVIDGELFWNQEVIPDTCALLSSAPRSDHILEAYREYHRLVQKNRFLEELLGNLEVPVVAGYADGNILGGNAPFLQLCGYSRHEILVQNWITDLVPLEFSATQESVFESLFATGRAQEMHTELLHASGKRIPCRVRVFPHGGTDQRPAFFSATYEPETKLDNHASSPSRRDLFLLQIRSALRRSSRQTRYAFAVLALGIDSATDSPSPQRQAPQCLPFFTKRITNCLRNLDVLAQFDAEHFFIFLDGAGDIVTTLHIAQRIQEELSKPLVIDQCALHTSCCIGITMGPATYADAGELLDDAQTALNRARQRGENQIALFDDRQNNHALQFLRMEKELHQALHHNDISFRYQPILDLHSETIRGMEAFIRWRHARRGLIPASEFLPIAEHSDIIGDIDMQALRTACATLAKIQRLRGKDFFLGLNVSRKSILRVGFLEDVLQTLRDTGLSPASLRLEIRESWFDEHADQLRLILDQARGMGLGVVLDNFNAAHVSLLDLHQLPLHGLKLDAPLPHAKPVMANLAAIAWNAGLSLTVSKIETQGGIHNLFEQGCTFGQGLALAPVMDETALIGYVRAHA